MLSNRQSLRSLVSFLVAWSFLVLTVTGIVLYVVPQGRIAYWTHWSLAGMDKNQWSWVHMMFGGVFIVSGAIHLYFNWKPFKAFLAARVRGHLKPKREVFIATGLSLLVFFTSVFRLPPASWVIDLNEWIKASWVTSPELEPPFGHAEEVSLGGMARRLNLDLERSLAALRDQGFVVADKRQTLDQIARANATTPMVIYQVIRAFEFPQESSLGELTMEELEARYAGTGLGRKSLAELFELAGVDARTGLERLSRAGIEAMPEEQAKEIGEKSSRTPMELLRIITIP